MALVPIVFLIVFLAGAVRLAFRGQALCGALIGLGTLGFFGAFMLPATGTRLRHVELPPFFETTSIVGPGGRTFTATIPLARIPRYDSDGRFESGWFVHSAGGTFAIGLTADGRIAVAAARTKQIEFFNLDGSLAGPPRPFTLITWPGESMNEGMLRPSNCRVEGVVFVDPNQVKNPPAHWATLMLFPLWHPFVAWLLMVLGFVGTRVRGLVAGEGF